MRARRFPTILPAMTLPKAIETTRVHRVAGLTGDRTALVTTRPFRAPHQTISDAGLIGGGHVPMPGGVSLAHHGVLFLDARPEFRRRVMEAWQPPLEGGVVYRQSPHVVDLLALAGIAVRTQRVSRHGRRGPSQSCTLMEDRSSSNAVGRGRTAAA
jgi:Magnesium chelatase, subunit ChlI